MVRCDWDPAKDVRNRRKHGISFAVAAEAFDDPFALVAFDRTVEGEDRWKALGQTFDRVTVVVSFTIRDREEPDVIRIISARRALRHERFRYEEQTT